VEVRELVANAERDADAESESDAEVWRDEELLGNVNELGLENVETGRYAEELG
jgi:hypothetical protein